MRDLYYYNSDVVAWARLRPLMESAKDRGAELREIVAYPEHSQD